MCESCDYYAYDEEEEADLLIGGSLSDYIFGEAEDDSFISEEDVIVDYTLQSEQGYTVDSENNSETVSIIETPESKLESETSDDVEVSEVSADTLIESEVIQRIIAASDDLSTEESLVEDTDEQSLEEIQSETVDLFRFRNTSFDTGTYVFVDKEERDSILADENLSNIFELDGVTEDGTINPAFTASATDGEDLAPVYRLKSLETPGTFLFVGQAEYDGIFDEESNQQNKWEKEGFDELGEADIPEFYLYEGSTNLGTEFNRFRNTQNNTYFYAGAAETEAIVNDPNLSSVFQNQGTAFEFLD